MSKLIKLSIFSRNEEQPKVAVSYAFDVSDIVSPITESKLNAGKSSFEVAVSKGTDAFSRNLAKSRYEVNDTLTAIAAMSDDLIKLTVIARRGTVLSSDPYVFVISRIIGSIVPSGTGAKFFYAEDGDPLPVEYEVSESVTSLVNTSIDTPSKTPIVLVDAATVVWDYKKGYNAEVTLEGNRTLSITNLEPGDYGTLTIRQDVVGGRTLATPPSSNVMGTGGTDVLGLTATPSVYDIASFYYDGTTINWNLSKY